MTWSTSRRPPARSRPWGCAPPELRDVQGTVWYVRNGEIVRVGNKSQGWAVVVLDIPVASSADPLVAGNAMLAAATAMAAEEDWATVFVGEPEIKGIESFDRDQTTVRLTARGQATGAVAGRS